MSQSEIYHCSLCERSSAEVDKMIVGPEKDYGTIYICDQCVDVCNDALRVTPNEVPIDIPGMTPSTIKAHLDNHVIGQDSAKVAISVAIFNHYKRMYGKFDVNIDKTNLLMIGPSGSGKTHIVKTIAKLFDIPYVIADATSITEAGYVGEDASSIIQLLLERANYDLDLAQRGIIFIDEIDKIAKKTGSDSARRDVSGEGVQQGLLKIIEGSDIKVKIGKSELSSATADFNTSNVLFIGSGAFVGLEDVMAARRSKNMIGIGSKDKYEKVNLSDVESADFIKYGLIPEFIGRFPMAVALEPLTTDMLIEILTTPQDALIKQYQGLFKVDNVDIEFDPMFLQSIAERSMNAKTGARGLRGILEKRLLPIQYELPELSKSGVCRIIIGEHDVKHEFRKKVKLNEKT